MLFGSNFERRESLEYPRRNRDRKSFRQRNSNPGSDDHAENFRANEDEGYSYVFKQPENDEERARCKEAMESCPVEAIGDDGEDASWRDSFRHGHSFEAHTPGPLIDTGTSDSRSPRHGNCISNLQIDRPVSAAGPFLKRNPTCRTFRSRGGRHGSTRTTDNGR